MTQRTVFLTTSGPIEGPNGIRPVIVSHDPQDVGRRSRQRRGRGGRFLSEAIRSRSRREQGKGQRQSASYHFYSPYFELLSVQLA